MTEPRKTVVHPTLEELLPSPEARARFAKEIIEFKARAMHDAVAPKYGLPLWDNADEEMREIWLHIAEQMEEIAKGATYDD